VIDKRVPVIVAVVLIALGIAWFWLTTNKENSTLNSTGGNMNTTLKLESSAFANGEFIGSKYTCDETNISPPLKITGVPTETKSLVLVMDDPDVPKALRPDGVFDHWVVYNIPPTTTDFLEGKFEGTVGNNGSGKAQYTGPCPPTQYEPTTHRYFFRLYATDIPALNFIKAPTKDELLTAIEGHVIAEVELMGRYDRLKTIKEND